MKILYSTPGYKPAYRMGGPIASVSSAAERLVRKGHDVTVVTTNANLDEDIDVPLNQAVAVDGVTVWYFRRREPLKEWLPFVPYISQSMGFAYAPQMRRTLEQLIPAADVVDTQMPFVYPTYAAAHVAFRHRKPLFYHQRGNYIETRLQRRRLKKSLYITAVERPIMNRASALIALTEAERAAFHALAPNVECDVVPNGVDIPQCDPDAAERIRDRYGIPKSAAVILYLGRLQTWKGADQLLAAFQRLQARSDVVLIMAGVDECDARVRWQPVAEREGWGGRVFFTGALSGREKSDILHRADLFSLPSAGEGLSMATLEALAHRTALMLSPECNFPEAAEAGAAVIVSRDVEPMTVALAKLLRDRERLREMGERGQRLMSERYSWDVVTDRLLDVYSRGVAAVRAAR